MKRIGLLFILTALFLVACGSAGGGTAEQAAIEEPAAQETAPAANDNFEEPESAAAEPQATAETTGGAESSQDAAVVRAGDWIKGDTVDPAVTIIEYGDFQCPGCAGFYPTLKQVVDTYPDDVRVVFRHFPLNSIHPNAQKAAEAAEAAGAQGKFWEFHDLLYERQQEWSSLDQAAVRDYFISLADELGLDVARFTSEFDDGTYAEGVSASEQEAISLGLPGTPAALVNGQMVPGESLPREFEAWEAFVKEEISLKDLAARQYKTAPEMTINQDARYLAHVEMASGNTFTIELLPKSAPQTVNSFVFLARNGWFDNVTFHRVIPGFVAQTGDPSGTGRGGPGYYVPNEIDPNLSHDEKGVVAMANAGPNTNGSQWYITYGDVSQLDGGYTIFGKVIEGMDAVEAITPRDPSRDPGAPAGDVITTITIEEILP